MCSGAIWQRVCAAGEPIAPPGAAAAAVLTCSTCDRPLHDLLLLCSSPSAPHHPPYLLQASPPSRRSSTATAPTRRRSAFVTSSKKRREPTRRPSSTASGVTKGGMGNYLLTLRHILHRSPHAVRTGVQPRSHPASLPRCLPPHLFPASEDQHARRACVCPNSRIYPLPAFKLHDLSASCYYECSGVG